LQISTDEVYGSIDSGSWDENSPLLPNSPYSASKAAADLLVRSYFVTHNLSVNITRCSNNYGAKQYPEKIIPFFVLRLLNNKKVSVYGDGLNVRDWLFVDDHCRGIYLVLTKGTPGEIYNVGGGFETSNIDLTKRILSILKKDISQVEFIADRLGHDRRYSVNWNKIKKIGYLPEKNFEENFNKTIQWYVNQNEH
jgi:dTDP-glucose 4,6-dehydratase